MKLITCHASAGISGFPSPADSLNNRYGRDVLYITAQGSDQHWTMRRQFLSPQYTTRWSDIPTVKA